MGVDIIKEAWNKSSVAGHSGGHSDKYYDAVRNELNDVYDLYNESGMKWTQDEMRKALQGVAESLKKQVESKTLSLY
jgi:hypothetical protein